MTVERAMAPVETAVLRSLAYADIFDYALTESEVHRDLVWTAATPGDVANAVRFAIANGHLEREREFITLVGRVLRGHLAERGVVEDDVRRHVPLAGEGLSELAERLVEPVVDGGLDDDAFGRSGFRRRRRVSGRYW